MDKLRHYLVSHLTLLFFSIFLPLFAIASVIFLIKLAKYTSIIELSIFDMGELYLFILPDLLFFTLPIAFFVSAVLTLYRLSNDNEMIIVFSLGINPTYIGKILAKPAFLLSFLLFVDYLVVIPYINIISHNFVAQKKAEAKFNLSASEFGHKFGDWMLFINKSDNQKRIYEDVVLFNKEMESEIVISAKSAELINNRGLLQLRLHEGESFSYNGEGLKQMLFKTAYINDMLTSELDTYRDTVDFWTNDEFRERKDQRLSVNTLLSLFPLISIYLMLALGIIHARHQKRWIYLWIFSAIVAFYALSILLQKVIGFHSVWVMIAVWQSVTYAIYMRLVGRRF